VIGQDNRASAMEVHHNGKFSDIDESGAAARSGDGIDEEDVLALAEDIELKRDDSGEVQDEKPVPLVTESSRATMRNTFSALAMAAKPNARSRVVCTGETSLEGLTREFLRPMLAHWLDTNLPPLVERLVAAEIASIMGKKG
jgi:cell pole-organizing protein PopZ